MNHHTFLQQLTAFSLAFFFVLTLLVPIAYAHRPTASANDLYISQADLTHSHDLYQYLSGEGWVSQKVTFDDFDYIYTLSYQLASMTEYVTHSLALAMIAVESRFDKNAESKASAVGLMQITPLYHYDRMRYFLEEGHEPYVDDFFDPRLNMACGIDYMEELLTDTNDLAYSLMCYNQGAKSAYRSYHENKKVSSYAMSIIRLSNEIELYLSD